ncbi:uncharacterized protein GGS22DRAFT_183752 [Annulohypoxylon maeteangense]|uniref:uncharacterized protein n=1 Tax=Annulohypoxylon maeteangense TaxID=1927788 RepID=UPI00200829F8|nr:uncharacterized protein GGS22DRAFT_183752 [Annulohypoxylon maeteangense]KAI0890407.1 hypothetical protein GGS22DRAFT_183752 [Annulohypoxylon maeteangense]
MDPYRLPRHSSSHGTLRSSYSQGRPPHGPPPGRPLHKPLRSVNENSVLLPSPGALESMLKTTTETGDIGIFSIKPVPPSPKRRDTLSELSQQRLSPRPSIEELHRRNNGKHLPSYRDTTSEIISMYGSESHKSATSTLTPTSSEEIGLRSYSMTTCGSRHLSHHRSTTTLQSQASGGPLQRPRSPFPYPTRLKRPGVRPASPALTENGRIDYSRMVEIDRSSYRTVHGPYRPAYPPMLRRPPPLGFHASASLSSVSLPPQGPPSRHGPLRPPSMRTHSAASMVSWAAPYHERVDSSSSRASSLTSVGNMYHRMPHRVGPSGLPAPVPRYYDYTEGFEPRQPRTLTPVQPFAPVPTRASNYQRPFVLQESDDNLAIAYQQRDSAFYGLESQSPYRAGTAESMRGTNTPRVESCRAIIDRAPSRCRTASIRSETRSIAFDNSEIDGKFGRGSDIDLLPSQAGRESMDTFNPNLDLESKDVPTYRYTDYLSTTTPKTNVNSPQRQVQVQGSGAPTIRSEQGVILRDDTQDETLPEGLDDSADVDLVEEKVMTSPQGNSIGRRSCSEPAPGYLGNPILHEAQSNNKHGLVTMDRTSSRYSKTSAMHGVTGSVAPNGVSGFRYKVSDADAPTADTENSNINHNYIGESVTISVSNQVQRQRFQRHKRNQAVPRISTSSLPREDNEGFPYITPSCSTTPIVSPKPISPARQLKLKNSIPQLMKALPPLPGDPNYIPPSTPSILSTSSNEEDFSEVLSPFKFDRSSSPQLLDTGVKKVETTYNCDRTSGLQKHVPRLKLKAKASNDSAATVTSDTRLFEPDVNQRWPSRTPNPIPEGQEGDLIPRVRTRNRLKLRSSRSSTSSPPAPATVRRNAATETSDIVLDITRRRPRDLFTYPPSLTSTPHASRGRLEPTRIDQPPSSGSLDKINSKVIEPELEKRTASMRLGRPRKPSYDSRSMEASTNSATKHPHGLKRRFSNLRFLLARTSDSVPTPSDSATEATRHNRLDQGAYLTNANFANKHFTTGDDRSVQGYSNRTAFGRRVRSKLLKWVKDAKAAVRACAKRNHGV